VQFVEILTAAVLQLYALEVIPDPFHDIRFGVLCQQGRDLRPLPGRQPWLLPRTWLGAQRLTATDASLGQPLADRPRRNAQRLGDAGARPACLTEVPRSQLPSFPPVP